MIREIKFRAWDGKQMFEPWSLEWLIEGSNGPWQFKDSTVEVGWEPNTLFLQYTGLKDKNGVEIYEGDIIKHYWESESDEGWEYVPVFYDSDCAMFKAGDHELYLEEYAEDGEVIGNIYENPELLERAA